MDAEIERKTGKKNLKNFTMRSMTKFDDYFMKKGRNVSRETIRQNSEFIIYRVIGENWKIERASKFFNDFNKNVNFREAFLFCNVVIVRLREKNLCPYCFEYFENLTQIYKHLKKWHT